MTKMTLRLPDGLGGGMCTVLEAFCEDWEGFGPCTHYKTDKVIEGEVLYVACTDVMQWYVKKRTPKIVHHMGAKATALQNNKCVESPMGCGRWLGDTELRSWDAETMAEYKISALCSTCQSGVFGP